MVFFCRAKIKVAFLLFFIFIACGGDSGSNASDNEPKSSSPATFAYKTYEGLVAERPCGQSLNMLSAYVSSSNEEYLCCFETTSETWSWQVNQEGACLALGTKVSKNSSSSAWSSSLNYMSSSSSFVAFDGDFFIDSRDGQAYRFVTIGTQTWMAQNLNYDDGNSLCYDNNNEKCALYGRLYEPNTEICPAGWHLPTIHEWNVLFDYVGGESVAGKQLKSETGWNDLGNGLNVYNFSTLPAGAYNRNTKFDGEGALASFWSAPVDANTIDSVYHNGMVYFQLLLSSPKEGISTSWYTFIDISFTTYKSSIRCLKGASAENIPITSSDNSSVVSSSSSSSFGSTLIDSRDGQSYKIVKIGKHIWMAQNLNFETDDSYCYDDDEEKCAKYGRLYTWTTAMDGEGWFSVDAVGCGDGKKCTPTYPVQGVCPTGWHLPNSDEWNALLKMVGKDSAVAVLKSKSDWDGNENNSDTYGFLALPAGGKVDYGVYLGVGKNAHFWSSSELYSNTAYALNLHSVAVVVGDDKGFGYSVRCVMD